jgi:hypothetical protein
VIDFQALKEPLQDALRDFAFLDLEVCPTEKPFNQNWLACAAVHCGPPNDGAVAIFTNLSTAVQAADGYLGIQSDARQQVDVICELANVLAGQAYEVVRSGKRPEILTPPFLLNADAAQSFWNQSNPNFRFILKSDKEEVGGIIVSLPTEWCAQWI